MSVPHERLTGQVVLVGYGRVGKRIAESLTAQRRPLRGGGAEPRMVESCAAGPAGGGRQCGEPAVLIQAHIARAGMLVIATPDTFHVRAMIETARALNPNIDPLRGAHP
jgi:CPA2 family monovalent cation:H+ antiporter-2